MRRSPIRSVPLVALAASLTLATLGDAQQPDAPRAKEAVARAEPREIALPVLGLGEENADAVRADLLALETEVYACPSCSKESTRAGTCPKCNVGLTPETRPLFTAATASVATNLLSLTADPLATVRLSELESTLARRSLKVDDERFALPGRVRLILRAPLLDNPSSLESLLTDTHLFAEAKASLEPATNQIAIAVRAGASPPTRAKVTSALEGTKARLTDVIWIPMVPMS